MIITKINIRSYRSIREVSLDINPISGKNCYIMIGKNETGKSNILKAINLTNSNTDYNRDCNKEDRKESACIGITFDLDLSNDYQKIDKLIKSLELPTELYDKIKFKRIFREILFYPDKERSDFVYVELDANVQLMQYVIINGKVQTQLGAIVDTLTKKTSDSSSKLVSETLDLGKLEQIIEDTIENEIIKSFPEIIYWENSPRYLINAPIDLDEFSENYEISIPLRNIFYISGIKNIKSRIQNINTIEDRAELEQLLSESITNYINNIWQEHQINIKVRIEGVTCTVMIEDKDNTAPKFLMEQRSDGFKQFISILLNLSIEDKTEFINNKIILLDEPDVHLHPSGIRYLREELLNISKRNLVLIATHSIYMIDKKNLNRHIKVTKEKTETKVKLIEKNNPYEEELIYESLGTSIYEFVEPNMVIFEGKIDKDLFDIFTRMFNSDFKPIKVGSISADGVSKIPKYLTFFDGRCINGIVQVDSDTDGITMKKKIQSDSGYFAKHTFEINDILDTGKMATIEDLFPIEIILEELKKQFSIETDLNPKKPFIKQLEEKNKSLKGKINIDNLKSSLVQNIILSFSELQKDEIRSKYNLLYEFYGAFHEMLK